MEDFETGERRIFDHETGESLKNAHIRTAIRPTTDAETGEPEINKTGGCKHHHFQIPRNLYVNTKKARHKHSLFTANDLLRKRANPEQICCIEEKMVTGSQNMSPVVFMLPTLCMFPAWAAVLCCIVEVCIHVWAHKCNKLNNGGVMYKSPLHMVTSEFCAHCTSDRVMQTVGKLQNERKLKLDNRKLRTYVEKMSSIVTKM